MRLMAILATVAAPAKSSWPKHLRALHRALGTASPAPSAASVAPSSRRTPAGVLEQLRPA